MAKNIALFIDGTWNKPADGRHAHNTNVRKLFEATQGEPLQSTLYLNGVGTDGQGLSKLKRKLFGGVGGFGTSRRIRAAYQFLSESYEPGDQLYLFGFSRGAFAARSLAGFASKVGLLFKKYNCMESVEAAYELYEKAPDSQQIDLGQFLFRLTGHKEPDPERSEVLPVHFIGVWDTVGALGLPGRMRSLSAPYTEYHQTDLPKFIMNARQALALHELRKDFVPMLWSGTHPESTNQTLKQVWFRGAHADVGGGYAESTLSDIALKWLASEAEQLGLVVHCHPWIKNSGSKPVTEAIHHEIRKAFYFSRPTPRSVLTNRRNHAVEMGKCFYVHQTVCQLSLERHGQEYRFWRWGVNKKLEYIDERSLQFQLNLAFNQGTLLLGAAPPKSLAEGSPAAVTPGASAVGDWWTNVRIRDIAKAETFVKAFVKARCEPATEECEEFARSLALWILCVGRDALCSLGGRVESIHAQRAELLVTDHAKLDLYEREWAARLWAIINQVSYCAGMLPHVWAQDMSELASALKVLWQDGRDKAIACRVRAGLKENLPFSKPLQL